MEQLKKDLIAPCGMNCGICSGYLREKNKCPGCNNNPTLGYCQKCIIRLCTKRKGKYCFQCDDFPCQRLKQLDKRYRTKYGMSEIENLQIIRNKGIDYLIDIEKAKWQTEKGIVCAHNKKIY